MGGNRNVSQSQQGNYIQRFTNALGIQFLPHPALLQSARTSRGGVPPTASSLHVAPGNGASDGTALRRRMTVPPSSQPINTDRKSHV